MDSEWNLAFRWYRVFAVTLDMIPSPEVVYIVKNVKNFASKTYLLVKAKFGFSTSMRCIWAFKNTLISIPLANDDELKNLAGIFEAISGSSLPNPRL